MTVLSPAAPGRTRLGGRRLPGYVNLVGAIAMVLAVLSVALRAASNSPPAIAEFAPQAQQIKQAPAEQSSTLGKADNGAGIGGPPVPSPSPTVPPGALLHQCVGDPPRQIEDPQSPPCVAYWQGNNGGATYKGVTNLEVRIDHHDLTSDDDYNAEPFIQHFFNSRFEFYGRQINLLFENNGNPQQCPGGSAGSLMETVQVADAQCADKKNVFGADTYRSNDGYWFYKEMARHGLITGTYFATFTEAQMQSEAPYWWQYPRGIDREWTDLGTWLCRQVVGHKAAHAGDAALTTQQRVLGIYLDQSSNLDLSTDGISNQLHACGSGFAYQLTTNATFATQDLAADYTQAVVNFQQHHVTTVLCLCLDYVNGAELANTASGQNYHPEWIQTTYWGAEDFYEGVWPRDQWPHAFGMGFLPKHHPINEDPAGWAVVGGGGPAPANDLATAYYDEAIYRELLLIASGIQMAGPHLTPQTFQAGLQRAAFPNPTSGLHMGAVGFGGGQHGMTQDGNEWYWSSKDVGPYANEGPPDATLCYVAGGQRFGPGQWPSTPIDGSANDPYFQEPCDSGRYDHP